MLVSVLAFRSPAVSSKYIRKFDLAMSGKMSKFGIFSPVVYAAKFVLGEAKLNKV
jgi:hypothetical protein